MAEDKIAGDHFTVVAGHRGGDESVPTSKWISTGCSLGQLACAGGLGGAVRGGIRCRRRRATKAALQGAWESLECTGERASARRGSAGEQGSEMGRDEGGSAACRRSARALWARPEHARQVLDGMPARSRARGWSWHCTGWR